MKSITDAHRTLDEWYHAGCVGNLIFFRAPRRQFVDVIVEETRKMYELSDDITEVTNQFFKTFGADRLEIVSGKDGLPDRVKIIRRIP